MTPPTPVRIAVIGTGAFGRNHLRVLSDLERTTGAVQLVAAVEPDQAARDFTAAGFGIPTFTSVQHLLDSRLPLHAACVCTPTLHHADVALVLIAAGIDVLIEKPIAATLEEADRILAAARLHDRIVAIGHLERFNPAVTAALPLLQRPMFFESHRLSVFTARSLDVDVVLDLMIHDLDIVLRFADSPIREVRAVGLPVLSARTDIANVRVEFFSGAVANFTASRVSTERIRKLRFFQPHQYLSLDFARQDLLLIDVTAAPERSAAQSKDLLSAQTDANLPGISPESSVTLSQAKDPDSLQTSVILNAAKDPEAPQSSVILSAAKDPGAVTFATASQSVLLQSADPQPPPHPTAGLSLHKVPTRAGEPLRLEIEDFLNAVRTRTQPRVTAEQGRAALALALDINAAIAEHGARTGLLQSLPSSS